MRARRQLLLAAAGMLAAGAGPLELGRGEVVAFVGGTDLVGIQQDGRLEAALADRWRDAEPKFRDLAWEGDTVYFQSTVRVRWRKEAFGDWRRQLERVKATVVLVQFGKIESADGVEKLGEFTAAYGKLIDELAANGRRVVVLGPARPRWTQAERWAFREYARAVEALAGKRGLMFVAAEGEDPAGSLIAGLIGKEPREEPDGLRAAIVEKNRLWGEYWRPTNWKCLFGDDSRRVFSNAAEGLPSFREEWQTYEKLIAAAEEGILSGKWWVPPAPPRRTGSEEADTGAELEAFEVMEGFEVSLFADESHGVANPLSIRWDGEGRAYVACSDVYPQIEPGVRPHDRIVVLRDTDRDGRADASKVFAEGLNIPTGMEVGPDRVYVGQGTDLLTLRDNDGDGVADERTLLLSGFGNGDSHQTSNSFVWSPGGELWFCQGDGIESRVESPFGVSSLFQAGVFRLRPGELRLDALLDDFMGPGNPWGVAFDDFGQSFVIDGAGGISHLTPASIPAKRRLKLPQIGKPGGYCGVECIGSSLFPEEMQGEFVIGDYKKNQVSRFATVDDGAGFRVEWREPLLRSKHRNFRPIDVKTGPDGAIYIVDWYNPITCHQDDFYRHPDRDKTHGRIWRIAPKGKALEPPVLVDAPRGILLEQLRSSERWTRLKAKQVLAARPAAEVAAATIRWAADKTGRDLLEALALLAWIDEPDAGMAERALGAEEARVRAYAARVIGRWGERLENAQELLVRGARDPHPRVRMEAVLACAAIPKAESVLVAAAAAGLERDGWIDYAFSQAVHHLRRYWLPALRKGELDFGDQSGGLAAVLGAGGSKGVLDEIRDLFRKGELSGKARAALASVLIAIGEEQDLKAILQADGLDAAILRSLARRERPGFDVLPPLGRALLAENGNTRVAAVELTAKWQVGELYSSVLQVAQDPGAETALRDAATLALGVLGNEETVKFLVSMTGSRDQPRPAAVAALLQLNPAVAARRAAAILQNEKEPNTVAAILSAFASRKGGAELLAGEIPKRKYAPEQGERLRQAWVGTGFVSEPLGAALDKLARVKGGGLVFGGGLIRDLVASGEKGDSKRGEALFLSAAAGCAACHKVGEKGGVIGPDLSAVGSGVPWERIVTEVLWPLRQVKEGYNLSRITTRDGRVLQGYVQASRSEEEVLLRDFATNDLVRIPKSEIVEQESIGSLMPPTAQSLSREELADLFAYLFRLSGAP